jgi:phosphatidylglycerophosphate synthase
MDRKSALLNEGLEQNGLRYLPCAVSGLRLIVLPFLILSLSNALAVLADFLFIVAIASDLADGHIARRMGLSSQFGARFDATVDFLFVGGMFLYFALIGYYPVWTLLLIGFMFIQFIITSRVSRIIYDPVGKYYGSLMFGAIGLTLLFPQPQVRLVIFVCMIVVTAISATSRLYWLTRKSPKNE